MVTFTDDDTVPSLVTSLSHSWIWGGTNFSGVAEYFYNGFGQSDGATRSIAWPRTRMLETYLPG